MRLWGRRADPVPEDPPHVGTVHSTAADQKSVLAPNHSELSEPTEALQRRNKDLKRGAM